MPRRLLDWDPLTGVATYHTYDHASKTTTIEEWQDVEPILEFNKRLAIESDTGKQIKNSWLHYATIPIGVQYKWLREEGLNIHAKGAIDRVLKKLRDPDWRYLKTTTGRE